MMTQGRGKMRARKQLIVESRTSFLKIDAGKQLIDQLKKVQKNQCSFKWRYHGDVRKLYGA